MYIRNSGFLKLIHPKLQQNKLTKGFCFLKYLSITKLFILKYNLTVFNINIDILPYKSQVENPNLDISDNNICREEKLTL